MTVPSFTTSSDGTRLAYEELGDGPPVVVVGGMFCDRARLHPLAAAIAAEAPGGLRAVNYDRRGRGDSTDTEPYAVEREIEDLAAVIAAVGGTAAVYGHSSGAGLALRAAAGGLPITRLVLHEPPYGPDDADSVRAATELAGAVAAAVADDRRGDAITAFMGDVGLPPEMLEAMATDPAMLALAPTMPYDHDVMGDFTDGGTVPVALVAALAARAVPTLVLCGGASPDFFRATADRIAALLPGATQATLDGYDHDAPGDVVAPVVVAFLTGRPPA